MNFSKDYVHFASVYDSYTDIPDDKKLRSYSSEFAQMDPWSDFIEVRYSEEEYSENYRDHISNVESKWKGYCEDEGRHHALASPAIVNGWCEQWPDSTKDLTIKSGYLVHVNSYYRFMMCHFDYPHLYNPVQFAVQNFPKVQSIWKQTGGDQK